ncbi:uncharacterized protein LOC141714599 [Apium graveolens]|uniref:uncharacterized protein LOC141714599 n=1 Tax=Apium graveolens TaxID=4045 RepID=UPI003D7AC80B
MSRFCLIDGVLFKKYVSGLLQRCLEKREYEKVLRDVHEGDCGNHTGGRKLSCKILRMGYWPAVKQYAIEYVKWCDACQRHAPIIHQPSELLHPFIPSWLFMKWGMDIVGKMPPAPGQKVFMLAMTDYFSKWIEAEAFRQIKSRETPFSLVYGAEAVMPTEFILPTARYGLATTEMNYEERVHDLDVVDELRDMAKIRMASYQQAVARSYNNNVRLGTFAVSDLVLRKVFQITMDMTVGKFADTLEGPYLIDEIIG